MLELNFFTIRYFSQNVKKLDKVKHVESFQNKYVKKKFYSQLSQNFEKSTKNLSFLFINQLTSIFKKIFFALEEKIYCNN